MDLSHVDHLGIIVITAYLSAVWTLIYFLVFIYQSLYGYGDLFSETWQAFTDYDIIHLKNFDSKRVKCICSISLHIFLSIWVFLCLFKSALFTGVFQRCVFLTPSKNAIWPFLQHPSCTYSTCLCCSQVFLVSPFSICSSHHVHLLSSVYVNASLHDIGGCCVCDIEYLPCVRLNSSGAVAQIILILMTVCLCLLCANDTERRFNWQMCVCV